MNGSVCGPPMPPWNEISSSKAQPSSRVGVVEAPDHDVGDVGEPVRPQEVLRCGRGEQREWVLALDSAVGEVVGAVRAERDRAVLGRAHEDPADVRVVAQRGNELRMALVQLLEREPAVLLHQVDEPEVARAEDDDALAADVVLRALLLLRAPCGLSQRVPDHRILLVAAGHLGDAAGRERALDQVVEPVAVALLEGGALGLAVVGEDDDLVGPRRVAARAVDAPELVVELPQRLQRVGALEAGVVGDLVVAREGRVDRGAPLHHVREDAVDDQVADDDAHRGAHERVEAAAVAARLHVAPALAGRGRDLERDLPEEEDERARDVEAVREEGAVAGVGLLLRIEPADGQDHVVGLAGEEVAAARAAVREQPDPGRVAALDLGAVGRSRARHHRPGLLLDPAEGRMSSLEPSRIPAWLAPVCDERSGSHSVSVVRVRRPPSGPCSARCRRASHGGGPGARGRRSRGRRRPAASVATRSPDRFASRWITRSV